MSRALIITTDGNPFKFNFWCKNFDKYISDEVDKVYVGLNGHPSYDIKKSFVDLCKERNFKLIFLDGEGICPHGVQISVILQQVTEDYLCLSEDDLWILKRGVLDSKFKLIESNQYKMIASPRADYKLFKDINTICERKNEIGIHGGNVSIDYWLWANWFFIKTETLKKCQDDFIKEASKYNYVEGITFNSLEKIPHLKPYKNYIHNSRFFYSCYAKGSKITSIHPNWVFENDVADEVFAIASLVLIKELGIENCLFENQIHLMSRIADLFDKNKEIKKWDLDWLHATASSGIQGMYGLIRDEYNIPIAITVSYHAHSKPETSVLPERGVIPIEYKESYMSAIRYAMHVAFVKSYDRNDINEFKNDYEKYIWYHASYESNSENINYMANVFIENILT